MRVTHHARATRLVNARARCVTRTRPRRGRRTPRVHRDRREATLVVLVVLFVIARNALVVRYHCPVSNRTARVRGRSGSVTQVRFPRADGRKLFAIDPHRYLRGRDERSALAWRLGAAVRQFFRAREPNRDECSTLTCSTAFELRPRSTPKGGFAAHSRRSRQTDDSLLSVRRRPAPQADGCGSHTMREPPAS